MKAVHHLDHQGQINLDHLQPHLLPPGALRPEPLAKGKAEVILFGGILYAFTAIMLVVSLFDYHWTVWLNEHQLSGIVQFMDQTLFEGEGFGGSDSGVFLFLITLALYLHSWLRSGDNWLTSVRPYWGFIVTTCILLGVHMVHGLKLLVARARPFAVVHEGEGFSGWYEFGSHFIGEGMYHGSMPSGHTATVLFFLAIAYILAGDQFYSIRTRLLGIVWGGITLSCCLLMALSRSMMFNHWIGDCFFSIGLGWIIIHVLYYWVFSVPQQMDYWRLHGTHPRTPKLWELRFCLYSFFVICGANLITFGLRALWLWHTLWLVLLIVPAVLVVLIYLYKIYDLLMGVRLAMKAVVVKDKREPTQGGDNPLDELASHMIFISRTADNRF